MRGELHFSITFKYFLHKKIITSAYIKIYIFENKLKKLKKCDFKR